MTPDPWNQQTRRQSLGQRYFEASGWIKLAIPLGGLAALFLLIEITVGDFGLIRRNAILAKPIPTAWVAPPTFTPIPTRTPLPTQPPVQVVTPTPLPIPEWQPSRTDLSALDYQVRNYLEIGRAHV